MQIRNLVAAVAIAVSGAAFADSAGHTSVLTNGGATIIAGNTFGAVVNSTGNVVPAAKGADFAKACPASDKASLVCFFKGLPQGKNTRKCSHPISNNSSAECIAEEAVTMQVYAAVLHKDYAGQYPALVAAMASQGYVDSELYQDSEIARGAWTTTAAFISKQSTPALGELLSRAAEVLLDPARHEESAEDGESDIKRYRQGW